MRYVTQYQKMNRTLEERLANYNPGEGESKTVPDMTLPLRTLVQRYVQRREVPQGPDGVYYDEDSVMNDFYPEYMDAEEKMEFAAAVEHVAHELEAELKKSKKAAAAPADAAPAPEIVDDVTGI